MKRSFVLISAVCVATVLNAASIDQVIVRQQWPWSIDVKIEYRITGVSEAAPVDVTVTAYDGTTALDSSRIKEAISGDIYGIAENGVGTIMLDPVKAFGKDKVALGEFNVELSLSASAANLNEVLYKIVDLETTKVTDIRRSDFYNGRYGSYETDYAKIRADFKTTLKDVLIWTDVTNHLEYMTTKMVFRKIPAKDVVWQMGETESGVTKNKNDPFWAKLDKDFFIGVFPVTQAQYHKYRSEDGYGQYCTDETAYPDHLIYPVAGIYYGDIRRASGSSFCSRMYKACGLDVDMPTEAQWEFACRGGVYDVALYSGKSFGMSAILELSWCQDNSNSQLHPVNSHPANAYGLYDLLGNAGEFCRNPSFTYPTGTSENSPVVNPGSSATTGNLVYRGNYYAVTRTYISSAYRNLTGNDNVWKRYDASGFRVCFPAE